MEFCEGDKKGLIFFLNQGIFRHDLKISHWKGMIMAKKPLTKAQVVSHFAEKFEMPRKAATAILDEIVGLAITETKKSGSFTLPGLGKLVLVKRSARMGRNPATGATIKIPAKTVVKMRIAKAAKEAIVPPKK